eukprot:TRINITY_DN2753_c0_g4_i1.p1 TRINITY_DN2753_c0_g4~~TRINITY_DN2753_c0_g4_i1.p1  ORF type:complete len:874 (-),score=196.22 TRINITY_DN2753_c0_g4_i1:52-2673(-)
MWIFAAGTGFQLEVDVPPTATIAQLKEAIATLIDIPIKDQILLCGRTKLNTNRSLQSYALPSNEKPIFLFDRKSFDPSAKLPEEISLVVNNEVVPQSTISLQEIAKPPELYKLRLNEHKFKGNLTRVELLKAAIDKRVEYCRMSSSQQEVEIGALACAIDYTNGLLEALSNELHPFLSAQISSAEKHEQLLNSFPADLAKLRDITLHPALKQNISTLLEIVNEQHIRSFADKCSKEHYQLKDKLSRFVKDVDNVKPLEFIIWNFEGLQKNMERIYEIEAHTNAIYIAIQKDCKVMEEDVSHLLKQIDSRGVNNATQSSIDKLQEISDKTLQGHIKYLKLVDDWNKESVGILANICASHNKARKEEHSWMQRISLQSTKINDMAAFFHRLKQALSRQKLDFSQLQFVSSFPIVYEACLEEVSRRRVIARRFSNEVTKTQEKINRFLEAERKRRESFFKEYSSLMPQLIHDIIPGLLEPIRALSSNLTEMMPSLGNKLPAIDFPNTPEPMGDDDFIVTPPPSSAASLPKASSGAPAPPPRVQSSQTLEQPSSILQEELAKVKKERDSYKERIHSLEKKLYDAYSDREINKNLEEQLSQYEIALQQSSSALPETLRELEKHISEKEQLVQQIRELEEQNTQLQKEVQTKERIVRIQMEASAKLEQEISAKTKQKFDAILTEKDEEIKQLRASLANVESEKQKISESLERVNGELDMTKKESQTRKEKFIEAMLTIRQGMEKTGLDFTLTEKRDVVTTLAMFQQFVNYTTQLRTILQNIDERQRDKISLSNFAVGDLAMFFPNQHGLYEAFNKYDPGYFLADESIDNFYDQVKQKICIVGQIVEITEVKPKDQGANPTKFAIHGMDYYFDVIIMKYE